MSEAAGASVLVTGGTGFLGSTLVRQLVEEGRDVHVLTRAPAAIAHLHDLELTWHQGDLLDDVAVHAAVAAFARAAHAAGRAAHVVHGGALISYLSGDAELSRRVNVEGTRRALDACVTHEIDRVCHVSSVVTVGQAPNARSTLDEEARFNGARLRSHYVTTKRAAEDFALAVRSELDVVVVNPGAIFGPSPTGSNTNTFLQRLAAGTFKLAPPGSLAVVGVADVAAGIRQALAHGRRGRRYLLTESNWTHLELMRHAAERLGVRPPRARVPALVWPIVTAGVGLWDRARPLEEATPQTLRLLGAHYRFDSTRAREELGWSPRPFDEVLRETLEHLPSSGAATGP